MDYEKELEALGRDFERDIAIAGDALDVEWLRQPVLMSRYSKLAAWARKEVDRTKDILEVTKAELSRDIRQSPEDFGLSKVTDAAVESAILSDGDYKVAMRNYTDAKFAMETTQAAVRSLEHKKSALENLVRLHGLSYFSGPAVPKDLAERWREAEAVREKSAQAGIARTMQRKRSTD